MLGVRVQGVYWEPLGWVCARDPNLSREKCKTSRERLDPERIHKLDVLLRFSNQTLLVLICMGEVVWSIEYYYDILQSLGEKEKNLCLSTWRKSCEHFFHDRVFVSQND